MSEHTPGPWKVDSKYCVGPVSQEDDQSYGMIIPVADVYGPNRQADAELIASAPQLREQNRVLREALNTIACGTEDKIPPYRCIDFAMAKRIAQAALTATSQGDMGIETVTYDCGTSASGPNIARACPVHANCFSRS